MNDIIYNDSPDDITSVDLTIQAASGNTAPVIYANGRNQLPLEIIAKAMKENTDGTETILKFTKEVWYQILNLRHAETNEKLTWQGVTGWSSTSSINNYSREVQTMNNSIELYEMEAGDELFPMYVYTDEVNAKRIAVSIDTPGGKHFTTADDASGAERCSVNVRAIQSVVYQKSDLIEDIVTDLGKTKVTMQYRGDVGSWSKDIDAHYDNIYFSVKKQISNYSIHNYGADGHTDIGYPARISQYWTFHNDQHMLVANPSNLPSGEGTFGFEAVASWSNASSLDNTVSYKLFLLFKYNDRPNTICWTHFVFAASNGWMLPYNLGLNVKDTELHEYTLDPWFEFYDLYGNYGSFTIRYNDTTEKIEVDQK